jgi:hypothetical protein
MSKSKNTPKTGAKKKPGLFEPGGPGGPGRPQGSRNAATIALDKIADDAGEDILSKMVEQAKAGDLRAADIVLSRVWPIRRGRPLILAEPLPPIATAADAVAVLGKLAGLVGDGSMTAEEGASFATIIETKRKAIETVELEARMTAIEQERKQ